MSRKAALMTDGACVVVECSQSRNEARAVALDENAPCNQPSLPTPPLPQQIATATKPKRDSPRDQKRKAYYYNRLQPNNKNRAQLNSKGNKLGQRRLVHQEVQPHQLAEESGNDVHSRTIHAQGSFSANLPSQRPGGPLYTGQIAHITNNYYYITPDQVGSGSVPLVYAGHSHVPWVRPAAAAAVRAPPTRIELQEARPTTAAIGMSFGANDSHGLVAGSQAEPRSRPQAQPQPQPVTALAQQQGFGTSPRQNSLLSSSPIHRHVGIEILPRYKTAPREPSSSVGQPERDAQGLYEREVEPRPINRTQTVPIRCTQDCSKSI
ncbi:hypothetical protein BU25DRAFT_132151 [Macroventuria anomochaeta]|uniref:Uncharacterized protein n=1 Tax=Macroventuria anomochaeta TaxID=301207 RepID=A0ACB6RUW2_9PLEO|nr:uncharacterized protein BU25DRAFT_132151 [Macroventuria anomochaeta]KAF2624682.1 hypothetical protein BU25DRAFT_132151 [Macroventuria anomochaeta]